MKYQSKILLGEEYRFTSNSREIVARVESILFTEDWTRVTLTRQHGPESDIWHDIENEDRLELVTPNDRVPSYDCKVELGKEYDFSYGGRFVTAKAVGVKFRGPTSLRKIPLSITFREDVLGKHPNWHYVTEDETVEERV